VDSEGPRRIRLGYMGHLNLIAEETVKLLNRYPEEIGKAVEHCLPREQWENLLAELQMARQKEAGPLAGGRPQMAGGIGLSMNGDTQSGAEDNTFASYVS
jgi:SIT4-associating protein SAP185/190